GFAALVAKGLEKGSNHRNEWAVRQKCARWVEQQIIGVIRAVLIQTRGIPAGHQRVDQYMAAADRHVDFPGDFRKAHGAPAFGKCLKKIKRPIGGFYSFDLGHSGTRRLKSEI